MVVTFDDAFRDVLVPAVYIASKGVRTIVFVPTAHIGQLFPYSPYDVMTGQELAYLAGQGVELGSHGHQHRDMRRMTQNVRLGSLEMSKEILESLGAKVKAFAPPHGHMDKELIRDALDSGLFKEVFGTLLYPAGHHGSFTRNPANMSGYMTGVGEGSWPWEK